MNHPYKVYIIVPESLPSKGVVYPIDRKRLRKVFENSLKRISKRNRGFALPSKLI